MNHLGVMFGDRLKPEVADDMRCNSRFTQFALQPRAEAGEPVSENSADRPKSAKCTARNRVNHQVHVFQKNITGTILEFFPFFERFLGVL